MQGVFNGNKYLYQFLLWEYQMLEPLLQKEGTKHNWLK